MTGLQAAMIAARDVAVHLDGRRVLHGVDLALEPGEIVTLVGPNGSGKTTLMRAMLGAVPVSSGRIVRRPGLRIGHVPQSLHVDRTLPLSVNRFLSLPRPAPHAAMADALSRVGLDAALATRPLGALSGGQRQRVMLARCLIGRPDLLMLDEPTTGLDQPATAAFYRLIADLRDEIGCAVLMVSHDLHVVMSASDRVVCVNGHICCQGTPQTVSNAPEYRALFGIGTGGALALYRHAHDHSHDSGAPAEPPAG